ncbi:hypothetical protein [Nonomuraea sp. KM90]|uniref:hypothetical protein n=1 Tax=Nonomuraea sp. KM90 TaxID=3457428 RepID=UPI003FCD3ECB
MSDLHGDLVRTFAGTAMTASSTYDLFGPVVAQTGNKASLGYQGEYIDPDTGKSICTHAGTSPAASPAGTPTPTHHP